MHSRWAHSTGFRWMVFKEVTVKTVVCLSNAAFPSPENAAKRNRLKRYIYKLASNRVYKLQLSKESVAFQILKQFVLTVRKSKTRKCLRGGCIFISFKLV